MQAPRPHGQVAARVGAFIASPGGLLYVVHVAAIDEAHPAYAGQALYTRRFLTVYDAVIYGFNSPVLWRCSKAGLIELYDAHVSPRHLDIGVGTGRLLDECRFPVPAPEITLMDLNPNSLDAASQRLARYEPRTHRANVLDPGACRPAERSWRCL